MLIDVIERHLARTGTSPSLFGRKAMRDARFVFDLRKGRTPRDETAGRVMSFIHTGDRL